MPTSIVSWKYFANFPSSSGNITSSSSSKYNLSDVVVNVEIFVEKKRQLIVQSHGETVCLPWGLPAIISESLPRHRCFSHRCHDHAERCMEGALSRMLRVSPLGIQEWSSCISAIGHEKAKEAVSRGQDWLELELCVKALHTEIVKVEGYEGGAEDSCNECPICLEEFSTGARVMKMPCSHAFHYDCISNWLRNGISRTCPLCRF